MEHPEVPVDPLAEIRIFVRPRCKVSLPWPHLEVAPRTGVLIEVHRDADELTFGTLLGEVFRNYVEPFHPAQVFEPASRKTTAELIRTARQLEDRSREANAEAPAIHLAPGLTVVASDGRRITGGCCTCLCDWREWYEVPKTGVLWLGHDPSASIALDGESILAWSDTQARAAGTAFGIRLSSDRLRQQLDRVPTEMELFRRRVGAWVSQQCDSAAGEWIESRLDIDLNVSRDFRPSK